ncbi:MAG: nucleotide exchange factor GrpE [Atopobiaceae bacterium]|jgi:molecular chaperone GrpE
MSPNDKNTEAASAASGTTPEEHDVKVPIDTEGGQDSSAELSQDEEQRMVDEAIRRGEAQANEDFQAENIKLKADIADLRRQLEEAHADVSQEALDQAKADLAEAKKAAEEAEERRTKLLAEFQTFRRRRDEEAQQEKARAAEHIVMGLLPVIDDMERAIEHAEQTAGDNEQLTSFVTGIDQVHDKMVGVLAKEGVEVIDPKGEAFDPMYHQAVGRTENTDVFDETVDQVYQRGYMLGGKVIRSAMVTVSYGGPKRPAPEPQDADADAPEEDSSGVQEQSTKE